MTRYVAVCGPGHDADRAELDAAFSIAKALAARDVVIITGGLGGVMEAAAAGAAEVGGMSIGLLPGLDRAGANPHSTVTLPTGLGELRNALLVRAADLVVTVGGSWGTLVELALAVRTGVPVIALHAWDLPTGAVTEVATVDDAVAAALQVLDR
ncbi:MAG: TIGR00725 family protein [Nocardioidaceae bacterium]